MANFDLHEEKKLLRRIAKGDEKAFSDIFYSYHQRLGAYVYRITGSKAMSEEVVQDVFLKVWTKREELLEVEKFDSYLFVLSKNHALNCLQKVARERKKKTELKEKVIKQKNVEEENSFLHKCYHILDRAVDNLPPQQRKAYILSRRQRLKYEEVARKMNISRETVKKYLQHATRSITHYAEAHKDLLLILAIILLLT